jgi:hypothetical protein
MADDREHKRTPTRRRHGRRRGPAATAHDDDDDDSGVGDGDSKRGGGTDTSSSWAFASLLAHRMATPGAPPPAYHRPPPPRVPPPLDPADYENDIALDDYEFGSRPPPSSHDDEETKEVKGLGLGGGGPPPPAHHRPPPPPPPPRLEPATRHLPPATLPADALLKIMAVEYRKYSNHLDVSQGKLAIIGAPRFSIQSMLQHWIHNGPEWSRERTTSNGTQTMMDTVFNVYAHSVLANDTDIITRCIGIDVDVAPTVAKILLECRGIANQWHKRSFARKDLQAFLDEAMFVQVCVLDNSKTPAVIDALVAELKEHPERVPAETVFEEEELAAFDPDEEDDDDDDDGDDENGKGGGGGEWNVDITGLKKEERKNKKRIEAEIDKRVQKAMDEFEKTLPKEQEAETRAKILRKKASTIIESYTGAVSRLFFSIQLQWSIVDGLFTESARFAFPREALEAPTLKFNEWFKSYVTVKPTDEGRTAWVDLSFDVMAPLASALKAERGPSITNERIPSRELCGDGWGHTKRDKVHMFLARAQFTYVHPHPETRAFHTLVLHAFCHNLKHKYRVDFIEEYLVVHNDFARKYETVVMRTERWEIPARPVVIQDGPSWDLKLSNKWIHRCESITQALLLWCYVVITRFDGILESGTNLIEFFVQWFDECIPDAIRPHKQEITRSTTEKEAIAAARAAGWSL